MGSRGRVSSATRQRLRPAGSEVERLWADNAKAQRAGRLDAGVRRPRRLARAAWPRPIAWFADAGEPAPLQGRPLQHLMSDSTDTPPLRSDVADDRRRRAQRARHAEGTVALHEPEFAGHEWDYVKECIDTGWVSSVGAFVDRFERDLAALHRRGARDRRRRTARRRCTSACCWPACRPGDEVLLPALTFIATANAVSYCRRHAALRRLRGASRSASMPRKLEAHLRDIAELRRRRLHQPAHRRARSGRWCVMHVFGHPCDLDALAERRARAGSWSLIEDAAESLGLDLPRAPHRQRRRAVGAQLQRQQDRHHRRRRRDPDQRRRARRGAPST